jgi:hypothetical protein
MPMSCQDDRALAIVMDEFDAGGGPLQIGGSTELQLPSCLVRLGRVLVIEAHGLLQAILANGVEVSRDDSVKLGRNNRSRYRLR